MEKEKNPVKKEKREQVLYNPSYKFPKLKIPKTVYKQIQEVVPLKKEDCLKYLTAIALGVVPDRFGIEASLQDKMKALEQIAQITKDDIEAAEEQVGVIIDDISGEETTEPE